MSVNVEKTVSLSTECRFSIQSINQLDTLDTLDTPAPAPAPTHHYLHPLTHPHPTQIKQYFKIFLEFHCDHHPTTPTLPLPYHPHTTPQSLSIIPHHSPIPPQPLPPLPTPTHRVPDTQFIQYFKNANQTQIIFSFFLTR